MEVVQPRLFFFSVQVDKAGCFQVPSFNKLKHDSVTKVFLLICRGWQAVFVGQKRQSGYP